ncbi:MULTISPECIES: hypothetical protein [Psychrobacter]|uniref:hypothetical protein n=1 Tax=Psychrobacter TaxID=497 RepID=UPI0019189F14|nr:MULTISPECIES: hypothetical protein [Psychrobacter]
MKNSSIASKFTSNCLGYSRHDCIQALLTQGIDSVDFGHWLAIPSEKLLLVFRNQHCIAIDGYQALA